MRFLSIDHFDMIAQNSTLDTVQKGPTLKEESYQYYYAPYLVITPGSGVGTFNNLSGHKLNKKPYNTCYFRIGFQKLPTYPFLIQIFVLFVHKVQCTYAAALFFNSFCQPGAVFHSHKNDRIHRAIKLFVCFYF